MWLGLVVAMTAAVALAITFVALVLNRHFLVSASDTSAYHNTVVNLVHGQGFRVTAYSGPNMLGQHAVFVLALIAPLYALFPSVETLFTLQVWVVFSAVVPIYLIARGGVPERGTAFFVALLALTSPLLYEMATAPFHPESGILTGALWSYFFYRQGRALGFWISFAFAISCAEQASLIYIALGLALFFVEDGLAWRRRFAAFALVGGIVWLVFTMGILIPAMYRSGQLNVMKYHYFDWGAASGGQLAVAVARDPVRALVYLLNPSRWLYVLELVGLPLVFAWLSPRSLILLLPFPLYFLLSDHEFFINFHAYYFVFAFFAGYVGLVAFLARTNLSAGRRSALLAAAFAINLVSLYPVAGYFSALLASREASLDQPLHVAFAALPKDAVVYTPTRFSAYLSNRPDIVVGDLSEENFDLSRRLDDEFAFTRIHPAQVDTIVCDILNDQCGPRMTGFDPAKAKMRAANIERLIQSGAWQVFYNQGNVVILRRAGK
jgi:uncharacterized membrane protein